MNFNAQGIAGKARKPIHWVDNPASLASAGMALPSMLTGKAWAKYNAANVRKNPFAGRVTVIVSNPGGRRPTP